MRDADALAEAVAEAIEAFDAANHAFGRFVTYVVRPRNQPLPPTVQTVREALQEAALAVPHAPSVESAGEFLTALRAARVRLDAFLADPTPGYALEEARAAPGALEEAVALLEEALDGPSPPDPFPR